MEIQIKLTSMGWEMGELVRNSRIDQIWSVKHEQIKQSTTALSC